MSNDKNNPHSEAFTKDSDGYLDLHVEPLTLPQPLRAVKLIGTEQACAIFEDQIPHVPPLTEHPFGVCWPPLASTSLVVSEAVPTGEVWLIDADGKPIAKVTGLE